MRFRADVTDEDIANLDSSRIELEREPKNLHDPNAVKCVANGKHIGYINKEMAMPISPLLAEGASYEVAVIERYTQSVAIALVFEVADKPKSTRRPKVKGKQAQEAQALNHTINAQPDTRCFVASYAYGIDDPRTDYFRSLRDKRLLHSRIGRILITLYYQLSPALVLLCKKSVIVNSIIKLLLRKLLPPSY
jgi:hypothetical protein